MSANRSPFSISSSDGKRIFKAIDTPYRNFLFRSRLEARWAIFMDWLRIPWDYEIKGFNFNGERYLPDFWLPRFGMFIEVKGEEATLKEEALAQKVRDEAGTSIAVIHGYPTENAGRLFTFNCTDSGGGVADEYFKIAGHPTEGFQLDNVWGDTIFGSSYFEPVIPSVQNRESVDNSLLNFAALMAKQARFEHGVDPRPPWLK